MIASEVGKWDGGSIWCLTNKSFPSNTYLLSYSDSENSFLIDPGLDGELIDSELKRLSLRPSQIFCTHGHFDHIGSAGYLQRLYGCEVFLHEEDKGQAKSSNFMLAAFRIPQKIELPKFTYVNEGFSTQIGSERLRFLYAPGHSPGSCIIEVGKAWFTGDTLLLRGTGLSKLPGEDADRLRKSLLGLWPLLTEDRIIYPGHGGIASGAKLRTKNSDLIEFIGIAGFENESN